MSQNNIHEQHLQLAEQTVKALTKPSPPAGLTEIWLHGSVARKEDTELSDVDLLLILAKGGDAWLPGVNAIFELLDQAQVPIRQRSRRSEKFPGTVQIDIYPKDEFRDPISMLARAYSSAALREIRNTVEFLETVRSEGQQLFRK